MMERKSLIVIIVLAVLLVVSLGYISYGIYQTRLAEVYQEGALYGYEQAGFAIFQQVANCQVVPMNYQNVTVNLVARECLG